MRALTPSERDDFFADYPWLSIETTLGMLPEWGDVTSWNGRFILVYKPQDVFYLTDISDRADLIASYHAAAGYNPLDRSMWYHLPAETVGRVLEVYNNVTDVVSQIPNALGPSTTMPIAIIGLVILALWFIPRQR